MIFSIVWRRGNLGASERSPHKRSDIGLAVPACCFARSTGFTWAIHRDFFRLAKDRPAIMRPAKLTNKLPSEMRLFFSDISRA
jgi:hypothetical protein